MPDATVKYILEFFFSSTTHYLCLAALLLIIFDHPSTVIKHYAQREKEKPNG